MFILGVITSSSAFATPTSLFWTNCTTDVQPKGTYHIGIDNYSSLGNRTKNGSSFAPDFGLTAGLLSWEGLSAEVGIDYLGGVTHPTYFNGKIGLAEGKLFELSPSLSIGVFNVGTSHNTNQCVGDVVIGTTLPANLGRLFAGGYTAKRAIGKHRSGWMVGYQKPFCSCKDASGADYNRWQFNADFASNKNAIGGGGFAMSYYFTPTISIETGPVWFNDTTRNGRWKWSVQLDIDV